MKKISIIILAVIGITVSGCQTVQPMKHTVSGRPEIILDISSAEAIGLISEKCMNMGLLIYEQSNHHVICGKKMSGMEAGFAQLLIGNAYSTTPDQKIRFSVVQTNSGTRIQAYQWIETQMAFGQVQQQELNSGEQFNSIQNMLNSLNPSKVVSSLNDGPIFISSVAEGSIAAQEGIKAGSMIAEIDQQKVINVASLEEALSSKNSNRLWLIWTDGSPKFFSLPSSLEAVGISVQNGEPLKK